MSFITYVPRIFESEISYNIARTKMKESELIHKVVEKKFGDMFVLIGLFSDKSSIVKLEFSDAQSIKADSTYGSILIPELFISIAEPIEIKEKLICATV